jgi:hypothetical protein
MKPWEVDIRCPLCNGTVRYNRLRRHANRVHSDLSFSAFQEILEDAIKNGMLIYDTKRVTSEGRMNSATDVLRRFKGGPGPETAVSGGAFGQGKKR